MISALSVLVAVVAITAKASFVAPVASGYIYRNDNYGPASLIQLGAVPYQQPHAFAPPLPLAQPIAQPLKLQASEAYDLAPALVPLPYILPQPSLVEDTENDDADESNESSEEYLDGGELIDLHGELGAGNVYEKEAGSDFDEEHQEAHGEKGSKGYNSVDKHEDGASGHYGKEHQERQFKENEEEAKSHHNEADAHGKHYESGESYKGGDHGHKKHFSKGEDVTGYHKVFHKDEFKKDHDFYDVADKSGHFKKYENDHKKHNSEEGGQKEGGKHDSAYDKAEFGKAGYQAKGQIDENREGHSAEEGQDSHYSHEQDYGKEGDSDSEKEYVYDDEDDEE